MKNNLNEEINRIKFLCNSKNKSLIYEVSDDLVKLFGKKFFPRLFGSSTKLAKNFVTHIDEIMKPSSVFYNDIPSSLQRKTTEEIIELMVKGRLTGSELGDVLTTTFKRALQEGDDEIAKKIAKKIVDGDDFKNLATTKTEDEMISELQSASRTGAKKFTDEEARELVNLYKNNGGKFKVIGTPTRGKTGGIIGKSLKSLITGVSIWSLLKFGLIGWGIWEIWKALVNNGETGYPECINQKVTESDVKLMEGKDNEKLGLLIRNTGIKEFDKLGGGRFFQNGKFKTDDGSLEGNWKENSKYGIVININGTDNIMSCDGKITTDLEDSIKIEIPKTPLDIEIEKWENEGAKYEECKSPPYKLGCTDSKYYDEIELIQKCTGYSPVDGRFTPEFLKFLVKNNYPKSLTRSNVEFIAQNCKPIKMR